MKTKTERCRDFKEEFGPPQKTRTVDIAQTVAEVYGYWTDGHQFIIIKRDQKGLYDPINARYICAEEYEILASLSYDGTF